MNEEMIATTETSEIPPGAAESPTVETPSSILTVEESASSPPTRFKRIIKTIGWIFLAIFFTVFFTLLKLPEDRLKNFIQGNIAAALSSQGIGFTAGSGHLSILFGASYVMKDITLTPPPPSEPIRLASVTVSPSFFSMLIGKMAGDIEIRQTPQEGKAETHFSTKGSNVHLSYAIKGLDVGKLGILPALAGIRGSFLLSGTGELSGDMSDPSSLLGKLQLEISKLTLDQQSIMGFSVPAIRVSEGKIDLAVDKGKANIQTVKLGKSAADDLRLNLTGHIGLTRQWAQSNLNLKAEFSLSESVLKSFILLDALLGPGKQPDGSYAFALTGPVMSVNPVPIAAGSK